ncbi:hypothetical protein [Arenibaculum pallidiluteum]|uniref:hypothetical protein n=1 Tax=Arenibaculum pallidiluteum TaxID=2812559 RepID=UPI001A971682|nr:hypothetical protein [Arenibaculum pallidiluteum]
MDDAVKARYFVLWAKGGKVPRPFRVLDSQTGEQHPFATYDEAEAEATRLNLADATSQVPDHA